MAGAPIIFRWSGEGFEPLPHFRKRCDDQFVVEQTYRLEPVADRSRKSHDHFFAALKFAWENLPDDVALEYPSPVHLRKRALIHAGYADEVSAVFPNAAIARHVAMFVRPMSDYAVVVVSGRVVKRFEARSQSLAAMGRKEFQASKDAVLTIVAGMIGVEVDALRRETVSEIGEANG